MKKVKTEYECTNCGSIQLQLKGKCPDCGEWNTLQEVVRVPEKEIKNRLSQQKQKTWLNAGESKLKSLSKVDIDDKHRFSSGNEEVDRVLGGGFVEGSLILLSGEPGVGKSTVLLQIIEHISKHDKTIYISAEESEKQIAQRAIRLGVKDLDSIQCLGEAELNTIMDTIKSERPKFVILDSIQTVYMEEIASSPGSVSQVKECAAQLNRLAKDMDITMVLVGHITKDGSMAGPKILEHLVDATLLIEGEQESPYRILRSFKNRFGSTSEIGALEMTSEGLIPVKNPSSMFLSMDRKPIEGSCVFITQEGQRPLLIEIQSLIDKSLLSNPRRLGVGLDYNRLAMVIAILRKHTGVDFFDQDVYVSAVGGAKIKETASDLPVALSMISSFINKPLPDSLACFGEVDLTGEVRPVLKAEERIKEAAKMGFTKIIIPKRNLPKNKIPNVEIKGISSLDEAVDLIKEWL